MLSVSFSTPFLPIGFFEISKTSSESRIPKEIDKAKCLIPELVILFQ